ncbi:MAG: class I SAM-dependent methyltransferase [Candidatus Spechtbacteria bacterium]|nr:class I SAM-dependent methyltransferase [Candidatus Spechtbacteria bacterium]
MSLEPKAKIHTEITAGNMNFLDPQSLLDKLGIKEGMAVADFGCGAGHFAILIARKVGAQGAVYAIDIQKGPIESVRSRAKLYGLTQVQAIRGDLEREKGSTLPEKLVDIVFCTSVLFQVKDKGAIIREAKRVLKKKGKLVIIEWRAEAPWGPQTKARLSREDFVTLAEKEGFVLEKEFAAGSHHYGLVFGI